MRIFLHLGLPLMVLGARFGIVVEVVQGFGVQIAAVTAIILGFLLIILG